MKLYTWLYQHSAGQMNSPKIVCMKHSYVLTCSWYSITGTSTSGLGPNCRRTAEYLQGNLPHTYVHTVYGASSNHVHN